MHVVVTAHVSRRSRMLAVFGWSYLLAMGFQESAVAQVNAVQRGFLVRPAAVEIQPAEELPRDELNLAHLEQMALAANPSLAQAAARIEAARGKWQQAGLLPNPTFGYSGQQIGSHGVAEQDGVIIGQDLIRGGKLRLSRSVAEREIMKAEQDFAAQELRVLTDVRITFYDVLIAQQRLELNAELVHIGNQSVNAAAALLKAKEVSRVDVLQAQLETKKAQILLQNAHHRYDAAWRSLTAVINQPGMTSQRLAGDLGAQRWDFAWDASLQRLLATSPEISAVVAEIERARWAVQRARAEAIPNITLQGIVQRDAQIHSTDGAIQVTMPFPVFNRNQGGIRQAEGELIFAERALQRVELNLQQRLSQVFERYANARHQFDIYTRDILPDAKESLSLTRDGYRAGEFGFLNLLTAQRTYSQTNLDYLEAVRDLWLAAWEIEGLLLSNSLQAGN